MSPIFNFCGLAASCKLHHNLRGFSLLAPSTSCLDHYVIVDVKNNNIPHNPGSDPDYTCTYAIEDVGNIEVFTRVDDCKINICFKAIIN